MEKIEEKIDLDEVHVAINEGMAVCSLTVAVCQIGYQTIVQTFQAVIKRIGNKAAGVAGNKEILNQVQDDKQEEEK